MSKALITEGYLSDIASAIRAKNGSADTYTPPQMAAAIQAIPTGGSAPLLYRLGGFFGNVTAYVSSLNVTLSGTIGETAILIVEHRTAINVTGGFTLVDMSRGTDYEQYISIYTKTLTSTTETVTITTTDTSNKILAAATVYFNRPLSIGAPVQQRMDTGVANYRYTILPSQHMRLAVVNNPWAGATSIHTIEKTRYVLPSDFIGNQNSTFRLIVFIIYDLNENVILNIGTNYGEDAYLNNRIFLYDIE